MATLLVRNIDDEIVKALKAKAGQDGISAEEEHRKILQKALLTPKRKSFAQALLSIPDVGLDPDFERKNDPAENSDVFT